MRPAAVHVSKFSKNFAESPSHAIFGLYSLERNIGLPIRLSKHCTMSFFSYFCYPFACLFHWFLSVIDLFLSIFFITDQYDSEPENSSPLIQSQENSSPSTSGQYNSEPRNAFYGVTPEASESSPILSKRMPYDVFINHRGCDVKYSLASVIYHTLDLLNLRAFLDMEELGPGDSIPVEIQEAMSSAKIHIAIFSEKYAESPWCLAELSFMLKTGAAIIPVYYNVEPDHLRWVTEGKGIYASAFSQYELKRRYPPNMLDEWKKALQKVSNLSGHKLNNKTGDHGMVLEKIVENVLGTWIGGRGGRPWDDKIYSGIRKIVVAFGTVIDSITVEYDLNGQSVWSERHGGTGGAQQEVEFDYPNEVLVSISGKFYSFNGKKLLTSITFHTNHKKYGPFGDTGGDDFATPTIGRKIIGFYGRSGQFLDAIGVHLVMEHPTGQYIKGVRVHIISS